MFPTSPRPPGAHHSAEDINLPKCGAVFASQGTSNCVIRINRFLADIVLSTSLYPGRHSRLKRTPDQMNRALCADLILTYCRTIPLKAIIVIPRSDKKHYLTLLRTSSAYLDDLLCIEQLSELLSLTNHAHRISCYNSITALMSPTGVPNR